MKILILSLFITLNLFAQSKLTDLFDDDNFLPTSLPGLQVWYEPSGLVGSPITAWDDISGNNNDLANTGTVLLVSNALNGYNGARSNGSNKNLHGTFTITAPMTVYAIMKQDTWINGNYLWDGKVFRSMALYQQTTTPRIGYRVGSATIPYSDALTVGAFAIITATYNTTGGTSCLWVNTTQASNCSTLVAAANLTGLYLFDGGGGGFNNSDITMVEFIIYAGIHDATTQTKVRNYLNKKYAIY